MFGFDFVCGDVDVRAFHVVNRFGVGVVEPFILPSRLVGARMTGGDSRNIPFIMFVVCGVLNKVWLLCAVQCRWC